MESKYGIAGTTEKLSAAADVTSLVSGLGRSINMVGLYGVAHNLTQATINEVIPLLAPVFKQRSRILISLIDGALQVDSQPVDPRTPFANIVANKLRDLGMSGFSLLQGMSPDELRNLVQVLAALNSSSAPQAVADAMEKSGLQHVVTDRAVYKRVSSADGKPAAATMPGATNPGTDAEKMSITRIMAFLKGDAGMANREIAKNVRELASSPEKLAQLIMESATARAADSRLTSGESLADVIVGCLRRTIDTLSGEPETQTAEGRINLRKSLLVLEQCVLDRLHQISRGPKPDLDRIIARAFREAKDDLEVSAAVTEYVRRKEALEKVERWMTSYMRNHPGTDNSKLEDKLREAGLTADGWQELTMKSDPGEVADPAETVVTATASGIMPSSPPELGVLAVLLSQLDELMTGSDDKPQQALALVASAAKEAESLSAKTDAKVKKLGKKISRKADPGDRSPAELLAEIAQELAQPVSVLNCTVDMLNRGCLGPVMPQQRDMLTIARGCGLRVNYLLSQLRQVVGLPQSLSPMPKSQIAAPVVRR